MESRAAQPGNPARNIELGQRLLDAQAANEVLLMIGVQPSKAVAAQRLTVHHRQDVPDKVPATTHPGAQVGLAGKQRPGGRASLHEEAPTIILRHLLPERDPEEADGSHDHGRRAVTSARPFRRGFHIEQPKLGSIHCVAVDLQAALAELSVHGHAQPGAPDEKPILVQDCPLTGSS